MSFGIRGEGLEDEEWDAEESNDDDEDEDTNPTR